MPVVIGWLESELDSPAPSQVWFRTKAYPYKKCSGDTFLL